MRRTHRSATLPVIRVATASAAAAALSLAGCAASPAPAPDPSPAPVEVDTSTWDPEVVGPGTLLLPPGWEVTEAQLSNVTITQTVVDVPGVQRLQVATGVPVVETTCTDASGETDPRQTRVLDERPVDLPGIADDEGGPVVAAIAQQTADDRVVLGVAITTADVVADPGCEQWLGIDLAGTAAGSGGTAVIGTATQLLPGGPADPYAFEDFDEAEAFVASEDYAELRAVLLSFEPYTVP